MEKLSLVAALKSVVLDTALSFSSTGDGGPFTEAACGHQRVTSGPNTGAVGVKDETRAILKNSNVEGIQCFSLCSTMGNIVPPSHNRLGNQRLKGITYGAIPVSFFILWHHPRSPLQ